MALSRPSARNTSTAPNGLPLLIDDAQVLQ